MFDRLIDLTEPICQRIDVSNTSTLLFEISGIEDRITENNPKSFLGNTAFDSIEIYKPAAESPL